MYNVIMRLEFYCPSRGRCAPQQNTFMYQHYVVCSASQSNFSNWRTRHFAAGHRFFFSSLHGDLRVEPALHWPYTRPTITSSTYQSDAIATNVRKRSLEHCTTHVHASHTHMQLPRPQIARPMTYHYCYYHYCS